MLCLIALGCVSLSACSFAARSPDMYERDTSAVLATRNAQIKQCYDQQLASGDERPSGAVVVHMQVKSDTGAIQNAKIDPERSTAPAPVQQCVMSSLDGLSLDPPDEQDAEATYTWNFAPSQQP